MSRVRPARWRCQTRGCPIVLGIVVGGLLLRLYPLERQGGHTYIRCPKCSALRPCDATRAVDS